METLKKNLVAALCVTLTILVYTACIPIVKDQGKTEENKEYKDAPEQIISLGQAKQLFDNYTKRRVKLI